MIVVLAAAIFEAALARAAQAEEGGLVVTLSRALVLAGALGLRQTRLGASVAVAAPVLGAIVACSVISAGGGALELVLVLAAIAASAASVALDRDEELERAARESRSVAVAAPSGAEARRETSGLALAQTAVAAAILLLVVSFGGEPALPEDGLAPRELARAPSSRPPGEARARASVGFTPAVRFEESQELGSSEPVYVATVRVTGARGLGTGLLLRAAALEEVDESGFFAPPPPEEGKERTTFPRRKIEHLEEPVAVRLDVSLERASDSFLLARGTPASLEGASASRDSAGNLVLARAARGRLDYVLHAEEPAEAGLSLGERPAFDAPHLLELPASVKSDGDLADLADRLARGKVTPHGIARAIERRLAGEYEYDLASSHRARGLSRALRTFLLEGRRGACGEFATAMAVLLRLAGVPSRVVTGYRVEPRDRDALGAWLVRSSDAHAWVEVPLEGAGFVSYDPTAPAAEEAERAVRPPRRQSTFDAVRGATRVPLSPALLALTVVGVLALGARAIVSAALVRRRRLEGAPRPLEAAPRFRDARGSLFSLLERNGWKLGGSSTPLEHARSLASRTGATEADRALLRAVSLYYAIRFSGKEASESVLDRLAALVRVSR
ncbi:transglutaminase domain-containing protein [bacterium]|nr:transglutaminase domain-containing protein [bacterium]